MGIYAITDTDNKIWVCKDKTGYTLSTDSNKACVFDTKTKADAVYNSSLSKIIKNKGVKVKAMKLHMGNEATQEAKVPPESEYIISILSDAVTKLNKRFLELNEELSTYDRQRTDVEHYIEFNAGKLNACDGFKAYKLLQDVLVNRRKVKDELQIIQIALDRIAAPEEFANIESKIQKQQDRKYTPREFKGLF